ncbi:MAG: hypothetical protein OER96_12160 [Gammaproteobacteria bacterium]|nr:hypothetical protein [Gammaproteobacteria bacterium]
MIKWDEIISSDTDEFGTFLQNYWNLTQASTRVECGNDWPDESFALTKAYIFLFGVVNWYGRQQKLSIADTYTTYVRFLMDHVGLSQESAQNLVDNLSFLVESSNEVHPYLQAGEQSIQEFVEGDMEAPAWLAKTLQTQEGFGVWSELSNSSSKSVSAIAL